VADEAALLAVADELYGLPLPEFTPARDARSRELKKSEPELAAAVKALRKASVAAWVVNLLVRREADQVAQVLGVGAALREAQASLAGDELRALTRQRRQLTGAVTARARAVAAESGQRVTQAVADQVEATLTAAILDEGCARAVRSGLLVGALAATGVDEVDLGAAVALPEALGFTATPRAAEPVPRPELHVVPDPEADRKALAAARAELEEAEAEVAEATADLEDVTARVHDLEARGLQVQGEIDELRRRLADLEAQAEEVDEDLEEAEQARSEADEAVREATRVRDAAAAKVSGLGDSP
jgi:hypothetical protein